MGRRLPAIAATLGLMLLAFGVPAPAALPASGRMAFRNYGAAEGLEHPSLTALAQDASGFLWAGTEGGAYRFDGGSFRLWSLKDGMPSAWVRCFASGPDGSLWIGTRAGLCRFQEERIRAMEAGDPLASTRIHQIAVDAKGRLWVAAEAGLFWSVSGGRRFARVPGWPSEPALSLATGRQGMWVGGNRVLRLRRSEGDWRNWSPAEGLPGEPVKALLESPSGELWVRSPGALRILPPGSRRLGLPAVGLPPLQVSFYEESLRADGAGGVLVPTAKGLLCFPAGGGWRLLDEGRGIPSGWANQALVDAAGNLWIASQGLHRLLGQGAWENFTQKDGLPADNVWGILRDHRGVLWVGTSSGLATLDRGILRGFPPGAGLVFYTLLEGPDRVIWGGGEHPFLVRLGPDRSRVERIPLPPSTGLSIPVAMAFEGPDALWVATSNGGLWRMTGLRGGPRFEKARFAGPPPVQVTALQKDPRGRLWAATEAGLARLEGGIWRTWGTEIGLRPAPLWALVALPDGMAWVSYIEPFGLTLVDLRGEAPRVLDHRTRAEGLASDSAYSLLADAEGRLWVGGPRGVQRWDGATQRLFRREDGLAGTDCNPFSTWLDPDGSIWFGSTTGLLHHARRSPRGATSDPAALFASLQIGSRHWDAPFPGPIDLGAFPHRERTLRAAFTSLAFEHEGRLRFQARLAGLEEGWVELPGRELRYPALPAGRYRLEVRVRLEDGPQGPVSSVAFEILPAWWNHAWVWSMGFLALGAGAWGGFRWRVRRLRKRNEQLERLVQERTEALERSNLELATLSTTDPLTRLQNRRHLEERLPGTLALLLRTRRTWRGPGSVPKACLVFALLDLDHFKQVNDTWGHEAGDLALRQLAELLRREAREEDFLVRWGGEEILFIGHTDDFEGASIAVARLHEAVRSHPFQLGQLEPTRLTCSIGYSLFPFQAEHAEEGSWEDQIRAADRCLYAAKRSGRDRWVGVAGREGLPPGLAQRFEEAPSEFLEAGSVALRSGPGEEGLAWD